MRSSRRSSPVSAKIFEQKIAFNTLLGLQIDDIGGESACMPHIAMRHDSSGISFITASTAA